VLGAVVAVAGLALVLDLLGNTDLDPVGVLWGLGAAVGLAVYFVLSAGTDDPLPALVVAWAGLAVGGTVLSAAVAVSALPVAAPRVDVVLLGDRVSWLVPVLGLTLVAAVLAYLSGIAGARLLGAKVASFVGLTEVLFAVLFAWLLLGQVLTVLQLAGGALVVGGIALVQLDEVRSAAAVRVAPGSDAALALDEPARP
jgi:drug/metabolite transporter (DMT)-like permease